MTVHHIRVKNIRIDGFRHPTEVSYWVGLKPERDRFEVTHDFCESMIRVELMKKTSRAILACEKWRTTASGRKAIAKAREAVRFALGQPDEDELRLLRARSP